ncbi:hypothetical protein D3C87_1825730 [compost metagenome]
MISVIITLSESERSREADLPESFYGPLSSGVDGGAFDPNSDFENVRAIDRRLRVDLEKCTERAGWVHEG